MATENPIPDALAVIVNQLREDKGYYIAWQSNIAMAFQDAMTDAGYRFPDLHNLANQAADNFLNNLMKKPSVRELERQLAQCGGQGDQRGWQHITSVTTERRL